MNKIIISLSLCLLLCNHIFAYHRVLYPMTATPDFSSAEGLVGWYDNTISISSTSTNAGFSIQVDFSTPTTPLNETILTFGGKWQSAMDYGIFIKENNSSLKFLRHVNCKGTYGFYDSDAWNPNILKRNTNYSLKVEIDETRLRYSIWEEGKPGNILYEYEFYGMASSYLKSILSRTTKNLAYGVNLHYFPQKIIIEELGSGVGVNPILPEPTIRWGHLVNLNSNKYLRRKGTTYLGDFMFQASNSGSANDIWEMRPNFDSKRLPLSYTATFKNLYSEENLAPQDCRTGANISLYETSSSDCNGWEVHKSVKEAIYFNLRNTNTNSYISVQNKSTQENAAIVTSDKVEGAECSWNFEDLNLDTPLETGYYSIQNKNSSKYLYVRYHSTKVGEYIVQHSYNDTNQNLWYIEKQPGGFYTISNMDSRLYMEVQGGSFDNGAYITQAARTSYGYRKWIIKKSSETGFYTIQSLASGKYMIVQGASTAEDAYITQYNTGEDNKLWKLEKTNFAPLPSTWTGLGGVYKIKNIYTNKYLVVKDGSTSPSEHIVIWSNVDTKNAWWSVIQKDNGAWLIKNLNSQFYMNVEGNSMEEDASIVQWDDPTGDTGNSLWNIIPDTRVPAPNIYWIRNVRSGKFLFIHNGSTADGSWATQQYSGNPQDMRMRWEFIRVELPTKSVPFISNDAKNQNQLNMLSSSLKILSNNNTFEVISGEKEISQIKLISLAGQLLNQYNVKGIRYKLNLNDKIAGVYLLNVIYDDKSSEARKILVK